MFPLDPATGPDEGPRARTPRPPSRRSVPGSVPPQRSDGESPPARAAAGPDIVPAQALAQGGTFVRPGAIVWGEARGGASAEPDASCEVVEKALAAMAPVFGNADDGQVCDLLDELARARVWVPLPDRQQPVTDGCAVDLPVVTYLGADFVPCFTSAEQLSRYAGRRLERASDARRVPHIVVPAAALARRLPPGLGMALNPGARASAPISACGVAYLAGGCSGEKHNGDTGGRSVRVGHPPSEPTALLREVARTLRQLPGVAAASRAWLSIPGSGEGLVLSVTLDDPASEDARTAVVRAIERAVASAPQRPQHPIDVTFPGEAAPDIVDNWIAGHAGSFYTRDGR